MWHVFYSRKVCKTKMCASSGSYYELRLGRIARLLNIRRIESQKKKKISSSPNIHYVAQNHVQNYHMEPVIHGHICSHATNTRTHTHEYTDLGQLPRRWYLQTVTNKEC